MKADKEMAEEREKRLRIERKKIKFAVEHPYLVFPCGIVDRFYLHDKNSLSVRDCGGLVDWYMSFRMLIRFYDAEKAFQWLQRTFQEAYPEFIGFIPESLKRAYYANKTTKYQNRSEFDNRFYEDQTG
jgi:hypothetical protein